jgi:hypothetical protein
MPLLVNNTSDKACRELTHRKKIHILRRSARELTRVRVSLVDAMAISRLSLLGSECLGDVWQWSRRVLISCESQRRHDVMRAKASAASDK